MRRAFRLTAIVLIGLFEVCGFAVSALTWDQPGAIYGWNVAADGVTIINVEPGGPAARAGVLRGDQIDYPSFPVLGRMNLLLTEAVGNDAALTFAVKRGGVLQRFTLHAQPLPKTLGISYVAGAFAGLVLGLVGLVLVVLRPSRMTWGCALIAPALVVPQADFLWQQQASNGVALAYQIAVSVVYALQTFGLLAFASRFPSNVTRGTARWMDAAAAPFACLTAAIYFYVDYGIFVASAPPHYWALAMQDYGIAVLETLAVFVTLVSTYASAARADRSRLLPVIATFALVVAAGTVTQFANQLSSSPAAYTSVTVLTSLAAIAFAASIAYGVARHRVMDVNFLISRTLVYTILTVSIVAVFAFIEYLFGKLLARTSLATILEIAAAIAIGISLNYAHAWLDRAIDLLLFRRRHQAEMRLERASQTLPYARSESFVEEMLVAEAADALDLASAAVFRRNGTAFRREKATGWSDANAAELADDDHLVTRLRAELQPVKLSELRWPRSDLPSGVAQPLYAVPIPSGHHLTAIALYGGHNGGEDLDPDERRSLRGLAGGAALAYDHLEGEELKKSVAELRAENEALRHSQELLAEKILKHLS